MIKVCLFLAAAAALTLGACKPAPREAIIVDPDDALFDDLYPAKQQMKVLLSDPDSAKYENVAAYKTQIDEGKPPLYSFCGMVNSKNQFGGYVGYQRFVATAKLAMVETEYSDFGDVWDRLCLHEIEGVAF